LYLNFGDFGSDAGQKTSCYNFSVIRANGIDGPCDSVVSFLGVVSTLSWLGLHWGYSIRVRTVLIKLSEENFASFFSVKFFFTLKEKFFFKIIFSNETDKAKVVSFDRLDF
jgi:hypothetical protein